MFIKLTCVKPKCKVNYRFENVPAIVSFLLRFTIEFL